MNVPESFSFHEADVLRFFRIDYSIRLELSGFYLDDNDPYQAVVEVFGVHRIEIDNEVSTSELMAAEDGEVLTLEKTASSLYVIIEWNTWSPRRSFIHSYRVFGETVRVSVQ